MAHWLLCVRLHLSAVMLGKGEAGQPADAVDLPCAQPHVLPAGVNAGAASGFS